MAKLTSHTLNGTDGSHAASIPVTLEHVKSKKVIFVREMDHGGRLSIDINPSELIENEMYQLIFNVSDYWKEKKISDPDLLNEIAIRFKVTDLCGSYHIPVILSPNSYTVWKSS